MRKRMAEARPIRHRLIAEAQGCEICGHSPRHPHRGKPAECSQLCCHEIACGPNRQKALDKPFAILVLCWWCNGHVVVCSREWPEAKQLAVLRAARPGDYDLAAYNRLVNERAPERITESEVDEWTKCI